MAFTNPVLTTVVVILSIFIFGSFVHEFWGSYQNESQHNIGCYVVDHSLNRTKSLLKRISDTQN